MEYIIFYKLSERGVSLEFFRCCFINLRGHRISPEASKTLFCANEFLTSLSSIKHIVLEKGAGVEDSFNHTVSKAQALKENVQKGHFHLISYYIDNVAVSSDLFFNSIQDDENNPAIIHSQNCSDNLIAAAKSVRPD